MSVIAFYFLVCTSLTVLWGMCVLLTWREATVASSHDVGYDSVDACFYGIARVLIATLLLAGGVYALGVYYGVGPQYASGQIRMHITNTWTVDGVFVTTYEVRGYEGRNDMFLSQQLSTPDEEIYRQLQNYNNQEVVIEYDQWYYNPWYAGETNRQVVSVRLVDDDDDE